MMWWLVVAPPGLANKKDRSEKQEIASQKTNRFLPKKRLIFTSALVLYKFKIYSA